MEKIVQTKIKTLLVATIAMQLLSSLYYGSLLVDSLKEFALYGGSGFYGGIFEYLLFEIVRYAVLIFAFRFLKKSLDKPWSEIACGIWFIITLPTWAVPFSAYGLFLIYKTSNQIRSFFDELKT